MKTILKKIFSVAFSVFFVNLVSFPVHCSGGIKKTDEEKKPYKEESPVISQDMYRIFWTLEKRKFISRSDTILIGLGVRGFRNSYMNYFGTNFKRIVFESGSISFKCFENILLKLNINEKENVWKKEIYPLVAKDGKVNITVKDAFKLVITNNTNGNQLVFYFKFGDTAPTSGRTDYNFSLDVERYNNYVNTIWNLNPENPLKMGYLWKDMCSIEDATVPKGTKRIAKNSFLDLMCLKTVNILDDIFSVGENSFRKCVNLTKVNFHGKVLAIDSRAFKDCYSLKEIVFPDGLKFIGDHAFENCRNLEKITIPVSTEIIYKDAFSGTPDNLKIVYEGVEYDKNTFLNFISFVKEIYIDY